MGHLKSVFFLGMMVISLSLCSDETLSSQQILYTLQTKNVQRAIDLYQIYLKENGKPDFELLQKLGLNLIDQGRQSHDPEVQVLTLFGAGISNNEKALYVLEEGLKSPLPQIQWIALNLLSKYQNDEADEILCRALRSNYLLVRLEALNRLAEKKHPKASAQIEALMCKVDETFLPLFPKFFAMVGDDSSIKHLKKLLNHSSQAVRLAAILSCAKFGRDDLLPQIRILASHPEAPQQEVCAVALGLLHDEKSVPRLSILAKSPTCHVRLAALMALYRLGRHDVKEEIEALACDSNVFAIHALGEVPGSEMVLRKLLNSNQSQVKFNAGIALLHRQDPTCQSVLKEILTHDSRDLFFDKITSVGGGISAWRVIPNGKQYFKEDALAYDTSLSMREEALKLALELPEQNFLQIAAFLFENQQNELVPTLVHLLENLQTPQTIQLLQKYAQKPGAPLIRNYCNLALFSLGEEGNYGNLLKEWVLTQQQKELIQFRHYSPWETRDDGQYALTPNETSRLLVDALETFARDQTDKGIGVLLDVISHGNEKNRYALAGLLIHATL